jgi:hypothetical protein
MADTSFKRYEKPVEGFKFTPPMEEVMIGKVSDPGAMREDHRERIIQRFRDR